MKAYLFYLVLPNESIIRTKYGDETYENFSNVIQSINMLRKIEEDDKKIILYALTNKKKYAEIYENLHDMNLFKKVEKKMSEDEYDLLRKENLLSVLDWREFDDNYVDDEGNPYKILAPKVEVLEYTDTMNFYINDVLMEASGDEYKHYKDQYIKALDILMYCTQHTLNLDNDMTDMTSYNMSYGYSTEGFVHGKHGRFDIIPNYLALYVKFYGLLLKKGTD